MLGHLRNNVAPDRGVLFEQVEASLPRLLVSARRQHRDRRARTIRVIARPDSGRMREGDGVSKVHGLAFGLGMIGIDQHDLSRKSAEQQGICESRANAADANYRNSSGAEMRARFCQLFLR